VLAVQKGTTAFFHISRPHLGTPLHTCKHLGRQRQEGWFTHSLHRCAGHQRTAIPRSDLRTNYTKVTNMRRAEKMWIEVRALAPLASTSSLCRPWNPRARQQKYSSTNDVGLGNRLLRKNILVGSVLPTFKVLQEELEKGTCCWWCWCCRC
jgi:hypothetical protein